MTDSTPMTALRTRMPVSPSRVNDCITDKKPLTKSHAAKKIEMVTIVAPGQAIARIPG